MVDRLRHATVYVPSGSGGRLTDITVKSLASTLLSSLSTRAPALFSACISLKRASIGSVNHKVMRSGDASRVELAGGSERTTLACASATCD